MAISTEEKPPEAIIDFAIEQALQWIRNDLATMDITFDHWFSERSLYGQGGIDRAIRQLEEKDLIYQGVLSPPKGKLPKEWESRPQWLFRSTRFGDEVDRPLRKSDGSYTYFAADIAYHFDKAQRGFDPLIDVWGADHGGYVKRVQAALTALTGQKDRLEVKLVQMVNLTKNGRPLRMSKRAGTFVTLREVLDEVGSDPHAILADDVDDVLDRLDVVRHRRFLSASHERGEERHVTPLVGVEAGRDEPPQLEGDERQRDQEGADEGDLEVVMNWSW